jgi:hypothetical protein
MSDESSKREGPLPGIRAFSRLLDDALNDATTIRTQAEALAADVLVAPPHKIYESAVELEGRTHDGNVAMGRLVAIVRRAHLHTLESAYRVLASKADRSDDAVKLRSIIDEYRRVRSVMDMSRDHIELALGTLADQRWRSLSMMQEAHVPDYTGSLIAKV